MNGIDSIFRRVAISLQKSNMLNQKFMKLKKNVFFNLTDKDIQKEV